MVRVLSSPGTLSPAGQGFPLSPVFFLATHAAGRGRPGAGAATAASGVPNHVEQEQEEQGAGESDLPSTAGGGG